MIFKVLLVLGILVALVLVIAAFKPDTFTVQREKVIDVPPEKIFGLINDFHNWTRWAPQDKEDSTMTRTYSGPTTGAGAISEWISSGSAGKGRMMIIESEAPKHVFVKVDFVKPFEAHNINEFTLEPDGASTHVIWKMRGSNLYVMKVMSVFTNMDRMAGKHFEAGLENLKAAAEK